MATVVLSHGSEDVAVVGALASMDEAVAMDQMRFVLAWAMRVQRVARGEPAPPGPLPVSALNDPMLEEPDPGAPSPEGTDAAPWEP
jgi:hypothetical protein